MLYGLLSLNAVPSVHNYATLEDKFAALLGILGIKVSRD